MSAYRVTIYNEFIHEQRNPEVKALYPDGIHGAIGNALLAESDMTVRYATLEMPEHGLSQDVLDETDVLIWWGHVAHDKVAEAVVDRVQSRVLAGMGLIVLHSGHLSLVPREPN